MPPRTPPPVEVLVPWSRHQAISTTLASPSRHLCHPMQRRKLALPPAPAGVLSPIPLEFEHLRLALRGADSMPVIRQMVLVQLMEVSGVRTWLYLLVYACQAIPVVMAHLVLGILSPMHL